ncbi:MAG TPA: phosphoribosyltransferase family protein [Ottowia sp.]|nr:ComF family protein [Burkholderiales bacterium]HQO52830.1 phosphoribosyltransferase family protein [Ottowia sp.]HQQ54583.1 phosphoribosyltransferase family protein [Ottowia sp.]
MTLLRAWLRHPAGASAWPSQCLICRRWPAQTLCAECRARFAPQLTRCQRCALAVPAGVAVCGACLREPPPMAQCLAAVSWQWPWSMCIGRWKFEGDTGLSGPLAALLQATPGVAEALAAAELLLPMPMSDQRLAERGYNPALLLARRLAPGRVQPGWLLRTRHTPPQRGLPRAERLRNVRGAFQVDPLAAGRLRGRRVLLVDDVMTTGASVREAAATLRAAGADPVGVLVLARTDEPTTH